MSAHRPSQRRLYDIEDLALLCAADIEIAMHPLALSVAARQKLTYWLGRAWDAGRMGSGVSRPPATPRDE